jgi:hypothetical protein
VAFFYWNLNALIEGFFAKVKVLSKKGSRGEHFLCPMFLAITSI